MGVVLTLPITSLPFLLDIIRSSTVAPLSTVFIFALLALWLIPYLLRGGRMPVESLPLIGFVIVIIASWAAAFFGVIPPYRDRSLLSEGLKAYITLAMGLAAYFVPATWIASNRKNLRFTLQLINLSGLAVLAWSLVQAVYVLFLHSDYPFDMIQFQNIFVARHNPLFYARVTGFAYEPSWLAHQLNLIYLPFWLSATLNGTSVHRKLWRFSLENLLLLIGIFVLFMTFSRVGWLSFLLAIAFLAVRANLQLARKLQSWVSSRLKVQTILRQASQLMLSLGLILVFLIAYAAAGFGLLHLGAKVEPRLGRIMGKNLLSTGGIYQLANEMAFAERVIYWSTGFEIFGDHPLLGVGLGNAGFYFPQKMPAYGWGLWEVTELFNRQNIIPNTKSLWVRILAETGLVGFAIFLSWYYLLWQSARLARNSRDPLLKTMGWNGVFVLIVFLTEGFSVDSLALPYFWFALGMLSAGAYLARRSFKGPSDCNHQ
jgi:O-antigen ligase